MTKKWCAFFVPVVFLISFSLANQPDERSPVPTTAAVSEAIKFVNDTYKDDIAAAKTPGQKAVLSQKLFDSAKEESDPSRSYAKLLAAKDIAVNSADLKMICLIIDEMAKTYQIDDLKMKTDVAAIVCKVPRLSEEAETILLQIDPLVDQAVRLDRYDVAKQLDSLALATARSTNNSQRVTLIIARIEEVKKDEWGYAEIKKDIATLSQNPVDPDANTKVGRFRCFVKGDWENGLPMLALGSDRKLQELSGGEIAGNESVESELGFADGWWNVATVARPAEKAAMQRRAVLWYRKVYSALNGTDKVRAGARLLEDTTEKLNGNMGIQQDIKELCKKLDPGQLDIAIGLKFTKVALPDRRGLTYFHIDTQIDNESSTGRIENELSIEVRILCVDADKKVNVVKYEKGISIAAKGDQAAGLGGVVELDRIRTHNNNNEIPQNAYVVFRIGKIVIYEAFLSPPTGTSWWLDDSLIDN